MKFTFRNSTSKIDHILCLLCFLTYTVLLPGCQNEPTDSASLKSKEAADAYFQKDYEKALRLIYEAPYPYHTQRDWYFTKAGVSNDWGTRERFHCSPSQESCNTLDFWLADRGTGQAIDAIKRLEENCLGGDGDACNRIGIIYYYRIGDIDKARFFFRRGHKAGHPGSSANYGLILRVEDELPHTGMKILKTACHDGNMAACEEYGNVLWIYREDPEGAVRYLKKSCDGGHIEGCAWLANYNDAEFKELKPFPSPNAELTQELRKRCCESGHIYACAHQASKQDRPDKLLLESLLVACTDGWFDACGIILTMNMGFEREEYRAIALPYFESNFDLIQGKLIEKCVSGFHKSCGDVSQLQLKFRRDNSYATMVHACRVGQDSECLKLHDYCANDHNTYSNAKERRIMEANCAGEDYLKAIRHNCTSNRLSFCGKHISELSMENWLSVKGLFENDCQKGNVRSCMSLSKSIYEKEKDLNGSIVIDEALCRSGISELCHQYAYKLIEQKNIAMAMDAFGIACKDGYKPSCLALENDDLREENPVEEATKKEEQRDMETPAPQKTTETKPENQIDLKWPLPDSDSRKCRTGQLMTISGCRPEPEIPVVAPLFMYGDGKYIDGTSFFLGRGSKREYVAALLPMNKETALHVIEEHLLKNGAELLLRDVQISRVGIVQRKYSGNPVCKESCRSDPKVGKILEDEELALDFQADLFEPDRGIVIKYISKEEYHSLGGLPFLKNCCSRRSNVYDFKNVAYHVLRQIKKSKARLYFIVLYDPVPEKNKLDQVEWERIRAGLFEKEILDAVDWLKANGVL